MNLIQQRSLMDAAERPPLDVGTRRLVGVPRQAIPSSSFNPSALRPRRRCACLGRSMTPMASRPYLMAYSTLDKAAAAGLDTPSMES
jgi:hypothetical protein